MHPVKLFAGGWVVGIALVASLTSQKPEIKKNEAYYADRYAEEIGGLREFVLPDQSRVDILTESTAYEVDYADKWTEGVGQALFYGLSTDREPGLVLIMRGPKAEENYLEALAVVSALRQHFNFRLETIEVE